MTYYTLGLFYLQYTKEAQQEPATVDCEKDAEAKKLGELDIHIRSIFKYTLFTFQTIASKCKYGIFSFNRKKSFPSKYFILMIAGCVEK